MNILLIFVADQTKVFQLLRRLGQEYEAFVTTMLKPLSSSFRKVIPLLQGHETMKTENSSDSPDSVSQNMAFVSQKQQYRPGVGGRNFNQRSKQYAPDFSSQKKVTYKQFPKIEY